MKCPDCGFEVINTNVCDECGYMLTFDEFNEAEGDCNPWDD